MDEQQSSDHETSKSPKTGRKRSIVRRFPLLFIALVLGMAMVGGSLVYAAKKKDATVKNGFDTSKVLPQAVTIPPSSPDKEFTAETLKQYDGKDGNKCYVAVNGAVYEISGKGQWQNGQHLPSNGKAYCGVDLTEAIKQAPHGSSKLEELPKVGTYKE
jgi:predicted heme/steroid binding protein